MKIRLLAIDLDGTLLDRQSRIPEENRRAVAAAREAGLEVVLVTGRSWRSTRPFYEALGLTGPAICYLGALVLADGSGRVLHHRPLAPEAWSRLREFALAEGLSLTACVAADLQVAEGVLPASGLVAADLAFATGKAEDFVGWEDWNPYTELDPTLSRCTAPPIMAAIYGDRSARRALEVFPEGLPFSQFDLSDRIAGETVLHVWHRDVDKGRALAAYCRARGIAPEEVLAIGDAPMDLSMLRFAGIGVAVPDGHEPVRAAADWVATPADAIGRVLRRR
ncbi:MAG: HAD family hydrolase [Bacillota bacterium]